jgi:5-methyltetrahydrofolate--homocysteine methyltransferase
LEKSPIAPTKATEEAVGTDLQRAIQKGLCDSAEKITRDSLLNRDGLLLVNDEIIPALNEVGIGFEQKKIYLPQLLMSAEAAKAAFEVIKAASGESQASKKRSPVVIATVKGDIHDIGKNIVKLLLENYGFDVVDLGKDVPPEAILKEVLAKKAPLCFLSALMTTTVPAMEETIGLLKKKAEFCRSVVGGAVLNQEYADRIGADFYAKDAMAAVRFAEEIEAQKE